MIVLTKRVSQGKRRGRNIPFLKRRKPRKFRTSNLKRLGSEFFDREHSAKYILQQATLKKGGRSIAEKIARGLLVQLKKRHKNRNNSLAFTALLHSAKVLVYFRSKKLGSMTYKIPVNLSPRKGMHTVVRLLTGHTGTLSGRSSVDRLADELMLLASKRGSAYKKRVEIHKLGMSGVPYLRYLRKDKA